MEQQLEDLFTYAIEEGNIELFDVLAKKNWNDLDEDDRNDLFMLVLSSQFAINEKLIEKFIVHFVKLGFDIDYHLLLSADGYINIFWLDTISTFKSKTIKLLISKGLNIELKSYNGHTLLIEASRNNNVDVIKTLLDCGADIKDIDKYGNNLLHFAAINKNLEVAKFFLEQGFDIEARNNAGETPLFSAAEYQSNINVIKFLLEKGADIKTTDNKGNTLLHAVAKNQYQNPKIIKFFIEQGLDIEAQNNDGQAPLLSAFNFYTCPNINILDLLLKKGSNKNDKTKDGNNLLHLAIQADKNEDNKIALVKYLIEQGINVNEQNNDGYTPLLLAVVYAKNTKLLDLLIKNGADKNIKTNAGETMLHLSTKNENVSIAEYCYFDLNFGIGDRTDDGETCVDYAMMNAKSEVLDFFLDHMRMNQMRLVGENNPHVEVVEQFIKQNYPIGIYHVGNEDTLLMSVARYNTNPKVLDALIKNGADINAHDKQGRNFVHYAAVNNNDNLLESVMEDDKNLRNIYEWILSKEEYAHFLAEKDIKGKTPAYYREHKDEF